MSEQLLRFLLSEIKRIRFRCLACKSEAAIDLPIDKLDRLFKDGECPLCREQLVDDGAAGKNPFLALRNACKAFQDLADKFTLELILPDTEDAD